MDPADDTQIPQEEKEADKKYQRLLDLYHELDGRLDIIDEKVRILYEDISVLTDKQGISEVLKKMINQ